MQQPLVSVIIPVYNTEPYLEQCLESIVNQSLREIEIICVDDGSTDGSGGILEKWAQRDHRISVYHQPNAGQSAARNRGIFLAQGDFLYFMDSDDMLDQGALEQLYKWAEQEQLDVVYFDGVTFYETPELEREFSVFKTMYLRKHDYEGVYSGQDLFFAMRENREYLVQPCLQFYRASYLHAQKITFSEGIIHEDNVFSLAVILNAGRAAHMKQAFFHRRIRTQSTMTEGITFRHSYGYYVCYLAMTKLVEEMNETLSPACYDCAMKLVGSMLSSAQKQYLELSDEERRKEQNLGKEQPQFLALVTRYCQQVFKQRETEAKIRQTYREKSELNARLQQTYREKSELNARLQQTYQEKSELNAKLQRTYREKAERGIKIKELEADLRLQTVDQEKLRRANAELNNNLKQQKKTLNRVKGSASYRIGRSITWPIRQIKKMIRKLRG